MELCGPSSDRTFHTVVIHLPFLQLHHSYYCWSHCAELLCGFTMKTPGTKPEFQHGNLKELAVTPALHDRKTYLQFQGLMKLIVLYEPAVSQKTPC